jgi:hypothetical protein
LGSLSPGNTINPVAPASSAFPTWSRMKQLDLCTRAMPPLGKPSKSELSQPLVGSAAPISTSTETTEPDARPEGE